ncbi:hypothetical protein EOM39_03175 [Candidatus Gracilibacteria bacterium]|nr:hypothetical protein [Candidatus Gracilibacteria bacterium]
MSNKLLFKLNNVNDFCKEKILFLYPIGFSVDMEYFYITNYNEKIPCNCTFNYENIDLILDFYDLDDSFDFNEIKKDILFAINKYSCTIE